MFFNWVKLNIFEVQAFEHEIKVFLQKRILITF